MRSVLRSFLFTYISLYSTQNIIGGFEFGGNEFGTFLLVVLALSLLNFFMFPIFKLMSLPSSGISHLILSFMLTTITLYILTIFVPVFSIKESAIPELRFFAGVIPSTNLTVFWSVSLSAFLFSMFFNFLMWLSKGKGRL